jgi:hypothetical protein
LSIFYLSSWTYQGVLIIGFYRSHAFFMDK